MNNNAYIVHALNCELNDFFHDINWLILLLLNIPAIILLCKNFWINFWKNHFPIGEQSGKEKGPIFSVWVETYFIFSCWQSHQSSCVRFKYAPCTSHSNNVSPRVKMISIPDWKRYKLLKYKRYWIIQNVISTLLFFCRDSIRSNMKTYLPP